MTICAIALAATLPVFDFATNSIAQRIAGVDPAVSLSRFVDYPNCFAKAAKHFSFFTFHSSFNKRFWLKDVDFSCVSPWNDECGAQRAGTLISKRHVLFAKHFALWKGARMSFVGQDGDVCPCSIVATKALSGTDMTVALLDYEVTPNIRPAKVLPVGFSKYIGEGRGLPIVTFNQREQVFLSQFDGITEEFNLYARINVPAKDEGWKRLAGNIVGGDSGDPAFMLIGDEAILLYCLSTGGVGKGPLVFYHRKEIQAAMDELCPGYKLEAFDFAKCEERVRTGGCE